MPEELAECNALDGSIKAVLRKVLKKRLEQPCPPGLRWLYLVVEVCPSPIEFFPAPLDF